jgi:hypothetical protein
MIFAVVCRKLLLSPQLKDSLLVLDDVWRAEVIRSFLLPVRLLVTTQVQLQLKLKACEGRGNA